MIEDRELPEVGTPEACLTKMKESYKFFLDSASKFVTVAEFYADSANQGQNLPSDFVSRYTANYNKLKNETAENFGYQLAFFTALEIEYVEEIKDNIEAYNNLINNGPDKEASAYDQACDYLAVKDEFTDLQATLDDINQTIAAERELYTNYNDPDYDYNARQTMANRFKED